ncbi:hypothetical protein A2U01_0117755, partial [Trifolium medium]|nr:hypothetical protein [Trifolium medium]
VPARWLRRRKPVGAVAPSPESMNTAGVLVVS